MKNLRSIWRWGGWLLTIVVVIAATLFWGFNLPAINETKKNPIKDLRGAAPPGQPQIMAFPREQLPPEVVTPETVTVARQPGESRADAVNRWAKGSPAEALLAYRELNRCAFIRYMTQVRAAAPDDPYYPTLMKTWPTETQACDGLHLGQLTMRRDLILKAGVAAVPGAFEASLGYASMVGTDGEAYDRAQFVADMNQILDANVKAAHPLALGHKSLALAMCTDEKCSTRDPYMSRVYEVAQFEQAPKVAEKLGTAAAERAIKELGPEKAAQAIEEGHALVASARSNR